MEAVTTVVATGESTKEAVGGKTWGYNQSRDKGNFNQGNQSQCNNDDNGKRDN